MRALGLLGIGALLWSPAASADGPINGSINGSIPCTCRAEGTSFALGAVVCMKTPDGPQLVRCERVLNNTSWQPTKVPCPTARAGLGVLASLMASGRE
jgi:hypothetical protein